MQHGLEFYQTHDGEVATSGNVLGVLPNTFFTEIQDITNLESGKRNVIWRQGMEISDARLVYRGQR